jgi:hypothetical protein
MIDMKGLLLFLILLIISSNAFSQEFPSELTHEGKVTLVNGDTLKGKIKYDLENDLIQIIVNGTIQTFSARKIAFFNIYDETVDMFRTFYSIPYEVQPNYEIPLLFEVLYEGRLSLLAREVIVTETVPQYSYAYRSSVNMTRTRLSYDFYFLDQKGNFKKYNLKKPELYEIMSRKEPQIKNYIKKNKLKTDSRRDLVRITAYYNALLDQ